MLRLLFAVLVAVTHSFDFVDGNTDREPLFKAFHGLTFGDLAVDGFFLISGYLVTKSLLQSRSNAEYLGKRFLRIYPGFWVATAVSLLVGLVAGGVLPAVNTQALMAGFINVLFFRGVHLQHAFENVPFPGINGSMWTIAYEFRCYLILLILGYLGLFRKRYSTGILVVLCLAASCLIPESTSETVADWFFGSLSFDARFFALFLTGSLFYICGNIVIYRWGYALACFAAMLALLHSRNFGTAAVAIFGGYAIFWFALHGPKSRLSRLLNKTDISYGFYLYAWPVGNLIVLFHRSISVWGLFLFTVIVTTPIAYLSWIAIEKPALNLKRFLTPEHGFGSSRTDVPIIQFHSNCETTQSSLESS